jgi:hypothetical protein
MLLSTLSLIVTLFVSESAPQAAPAAPAPTTAAAPSPAAVSLTVELNALRTIIDAMGNARVNSEDRIAAMNAFMKEKQLDGGYAAYKATVHVPPATSFIQGYQSALETERLNGVPRPASNDLGLLAREVSAATKQAHAAWDSQNDRFQEVAVLSAYLQSKDAFVAYQQWAPDYAAAKRKEQIARYKAANDALNAQQQAYLAHIQEMHEEWDQVPHGTGLNFNYGYSQGDGPNEGGTGQSSNTGGVGVNSPTVQGVNTPWAYAGAQGGFYPGAYGAGAYNQTGGVPAGNQYEVGFNPGSFYGGTTYNSYSDTYPDLYGYPAGTGWGPGAINRAGINNVWNRSRMGGGPPPTPNGLRPSGGSTDAGARGGP